MLQTRGAPPSLAARNSVASDPLLGAMSAGPSGAGATKLPSRYYTSSCTDPRNIKGTDPEARAKSSSLYGVDHRRDYGGGGKACPSPTGLPRPSSVSYLQWAEGAEIAEELGEEMGDEQDAVFSA